MSLWGDGRWLNAQTHHLESQSHTSGLLGHQVQLNDFAKMETENVGLKVEDSNDAKSVNSAIIVPSLTEIRLDIQSRLNQLVR